MSMELALYITKAGGLEVQKYWIRATPQEYDCEIQTCLDGL